MSQDDDLPEIAKQMRQKILQVRTGRKKKQPVEAETQPTVGMPFNRSLVERLMTIDMFYRKYGIIGLLEYSEICQVEKAIGKMYIDGMCFGDQAAYEKRITGIAKKFTNDAVITALELKLPMLRKLMQVGEGHIVIAGGCLATIAAGERLKNFYRAAEDIDIFFYDFKSEEEATECLKCLVAVLCENRIYNFRRSKHALTIGRTGIDVQFILRLYETKEQILAGFDLSSSQILFDTDLTLKTTLAGAISMITGYSYVDMGKRSISYAHRLHKYFEDKAAVFLFPGLEGHPAKIKTPDGNYRLDNDREPTFIYSREWSRGEWHTSDYDTEDYMNWWYIRTGKLDNLSLHWHISHGQPCTAEDVFSTTPEMIAKSLKCNVLTEPFSDAIHHNWPEKLRKQETLRLLFNDSEKVQEFMMAYYIEEDRAKIKSMWNDMMKGYIKVMTQQSYLYNIEWNVKDPGTQRFGQVNPIFSDPREWYGEDYVPTYAGIRRDVLKVLFDLKRAHLLWKILPQDVFRYILKCLMILNICDTYRMFGL